LDGQFYVLTGRQSFHYPKIFDEDKFTEWVKNNRLNYLYLGSNSFIMRSHTKKSCHDPYPVKTLHKILSNRKIYTKIYSNGEEGVEIYKVLKS